MIQPNFCVVLFPTEPAQETVRLAKLAEREVRHLTLTASSFATLCELAMDRLKLGIGIGAFHRFG